MSLFGTDAPPAGPPDAPDGAPITSGDPTCEVCSKPLDRTPTGRMPRKPWRCEDHKVTRSSSSSRSTGAVSEADLERACSTLRDLYDLLAVGFTALDPLAGSLWIAELETLDERNHKYLANNRELVKRINSTGAKSSNLAFVVAQLAALAPVVMVLVGKARLQAQANREAAAAAQESVTWDVTPPEPAANPASNGTAPDTRIPFVAEASVDDPHDPDAAFRGSRIG